MLEITIFKDTENWFVAILTKDYKDYSENNNNYGIGLTEIDAVKNLFRYLGILEYNYN